MNTLRRSFLLFAFASVLLIACSAHEHGEGCGCPMHKTSNHHAEYIIDPDDTSTPPDVHQGVQRYIADPNSIRPDYWDEEDDGPWEADLIENPEYKWTPRLIRNPNHVPEPGYLTKFVQEVQEATPWVTLGVVLVAFMSVVPLPIHVLRSLLSGDTVFATSKAALIGLATPLCSCGSLPIAAALVEHGIPLSSVAAFLTASQSAGLDSAAITFGLLGPMAAACRLLGALVLAVVAGTALRSGDNKDRTSKNESSFKNGTNGTRPSPTSNHKGSIVSKFITALIDAATEITPLVVVGLGISTAAVHLVPMLTTPFDVLNDQNVIGTFLLRIGVLASALPLQLCEHTTAALAAGIQKAGGSSGLAFAFLQSAPATNLPSLLLLTQTSGSYGRFTALKVALALSGTALLLSYAVDFVGIDMLVVKEAESSATGEMAALPSSFYAASPWLLAALVTAGIVREIRRKLSKGTDGCSCPSVCDSKSSKKHN